MALNFVQYINSNTGLSASQKTQLLDDYIHACGYIDTIIDAQGNAIPNPVTKSQYFNKALSAHILGKIVGYNVQAATNAKAIETDATIKSVFSVELGV